jgi:GT2 family glycosyltransferase
VRSLTHDRLPRPLLSGIAVNWRDDEALVELVAGWPEDGRFELVVVDNSGTLGTGATGAKVIEPGENLGFGGAVNLALQHVEAPTLLILNSDARPLTGALEGLLEGLESHPEAAGLAPRLVSSDGRTQHRWQLRPLPSLTTLLLQSLMVPAGQGPETEPASGSVVDQPAAAALALKRGALEEIGGFDEAFFPAWFEDVDLARRLHDGGRQVVYWPAAAFEHRLGATVPKLGYGRFLWIYYRNLGRYLGKHHSPGAELVARLFTATAAALRIPLLVIRKPSRAGTRREALGGLAGLLIGALSGWRLPRTIVPEARRRADSE